jgi:arabinofuranosyltransferase
MPNPERPKRRIALLVISLATIVAVYCGWRLFWFLTDDAFIAFRYISNSHLGFGYVWNAPPFRPVEGYTSFLWVALLDLIWRVSGVKPPQSANYVSLLFTYLTLLVGGSMVLKLKLRDELVKYRLLFLCLVLVGVITNRTFLAWSSSGLETAMFNFFLTLWVYCGLFVKGNEKRRIFWLCSTTALLYLTRPDGLLFAVVTIAIVAWEQTGGGRWQTAGSSKPESRRLPSASPFLWSAPLLIIPAHVLWRRAVYGAWLPNTYYAKTIAGRIWPQSGIRYFVSFAMEYALWFWLLLLLLVIVSKLRRARVPVGLAQVSLTKTLVCVAVLTHFIYYTIVVGGDHFEYRVYSQLILLIFITFLWLLNALQLKVRSTALLFTLFIVFSWPIPWLHWSATHNLTTVAQTMSLKASVAKVVQKKLPSTPGFVLAYFRAFDSLQSWLIGHFVCMRHQQHKVFTISQLEHLPTRSEGLAMDPSLFPVIESKAVGVTAWVLPRVNIIDAFGLNDYVVARNADIAVLTLIAHERQPPDGYVECFSPNVVLSERQATITARAVPLTAEKIVQCEQRFAALVANGFKPTPVTVQNPIDDPRFFARQQYRDVLNREPEADGLDNWTGVLKKCPTDRACFNQERAKAVLTFFEVPETQLSAFFIYRLYVAAYGRVPQFAEFVSDRQLLATTDWSDMDQIIAARRAFLAQWVRRDSFRAVYPETMAPEQFVNHLFETAGLKSLDSERTRQIEMLRGGGGRAEVLRSVVEIEEFKRREHDRGQVLLQFFFQLHRDVDYHDANYKLWLDKLDRNETVDYSHAICLFLTSAEYQRRFGAVVSHNNSECR